MAEKEISLLGESITFTSARVNYNAFRKTFFKFAQNAEEIFMNEYNFKLNSSNTFWKMVSDLADKCLNPVLEYCMQFLMEKKIYTVDDELFLEKYQSKYDYWGYAVDVITEQIDEIDERYQRGKEYRREIRENRGRWVGGGFGVSGAVKGAITAEAMNLVSGAGHVLADGVVSFVSSLSASSKVDEVIRSEDTYHVLMSGMWNNVLYMHMALIDCLEEEIGTVIKGKVLSKEESDATIMLKNLKHLKVEKEIKEVLVKSFVLNPYAVEWYRVVLERLGDCNGTITELGEYFGVEVDVTKRVLLNKHCSGLSCKNREETLDAYKSIQEFKAKINLAEDTGASLKIIEVYKKYFQVEGILFDSVEKVNNAQEEKTIVDNIVAETNEQDYSSLEKAIKQLIAIDGRIAQKYVEDLKQKQEMLFEVTYGNDTKTTIRLESPERAKCVRKIIESFENEYARVDSKYAAMDLRADLLSRLETLWKETELRDFVMSYKSKISIEMEQIEEKAETYVNNAKFYYDRLKGKTKERIVCSWPDYVFNDKEKRIVHGALTEYKRQGLIGDEIILMIYDNTASGNGKKGVLITNQGIYGTGSLFENRGFYIGKDKIGYSDLKVSGTDLCVADMKTDISLTGWIEREDFLQLVRAWLKVASVFITRQERVLSSEKKTVTQYLTCEKCGWNGPLEASFCGRCGNYLRNHRENAVESKSLENCPKCGNIVKEGKAFCNRCGMKVR